MEDIVLCGKPLQNMQQAEQKQNGGRMQNCAEPDRIPGRLVQNPDGTVRHETLVDFSKKHTLVICGCGFPAWDGNFDGLRAMCKACFRNPDMVCVPEAPLLNVPAAAVVAEPLLKLFEKAGEEYGSTLSLSPETIARLEKPMISKEEYLRNVNA